ncbi:MAG TPA: helicase, partial [Gammaproteobacteria bacterium]|nr:helicase [Gammaproteobacteria bacterium]
METDNDNPELKLANEFVRHTCHNIFLTGKAGTGKTTFLHNLKKEFPKRMIVTAPTGVAAINAGGVTLHSFFQMPFGPIMPGYELQGRQRRFNKEKINIIKSLDLLVIDEISMVRADLLDGIDAVLRRFKHHDLPFGGVQLLMIGDLHQLSPVVKDDEWNILKNHYETFYFFSSHALAKTDMVSIELKHIYRQSDAKFIALLNRVRNNEIDQPTLDLLNSRYVPGFKPDEVGDYITLSTHNQSADQINQSQLKQLESKTFTLQAIIKGQYPEHSYPTAEKLVLKKGAQVMFVRNDSSPEKQYFNGKIGTVTHIGSETISVKCPDDNDIIQVEPICWENIKYTIEEKTKEISEDVIGEFIQYPLRLAWAITIHKSQGLTFERAIIDANAAFSHSQVYVALSRCKTFEGMVLSTRISTAAIKTDTTVAKFVDDASQHPPTSQQLETATNDYQQQLLLECFNFNQLRTSLNKLLGILQSNQKAVQISDRENLAEFRKQTT